MDADCVGTLELANTRRDGPAAIRPTPIEDVSPADLRAEFGLAPGSLALLAGGPPCQPFTTSGRRRSIEDPRASTIFPAYFDFVRELRPQAVLVENVDGMLSAALSHRRLVDRGPASPALAPEERKGSFLRWFISQLVELGYSVSWGVVEAADHGVPQLRQRAIVLGVRTDEPCYLPAATHGGPGLPDYRSLREALAGIVDIGPVQPLSSRKREVYSHIPPGGNWRDLPDALQRATMGAAYRAEGGKSGWWRRLSWDAPAPTILGMPDHSSTALIHPDENRCLSVNECAAVQTFPPGSSFAGSPRSQYQQIGNAVPARLAERLGAHLLAFLNGARQPAPPAPEWRRRSANRRIGTHGWAVVRQGRMHVEVKGVRPDHIWHHHQEALPLGAR